MKELGPVGGVHRVHPLDPPMDSIWSMVWLVMGQEGMVNGGGGGTNLEEIPVTADGIRSTNKFLRNQICIYIFRQSLEDVT